MTTTFDFIVSFDEFASNIDELLNEAYNKSKTPDDIVDAINDDFVTIYKNIINDIESNKFDKISYRNILTNYFKKVEIIRDHIKSNILSIPILVAILDKDISFSSIDVFTASPIVAATLDFLNNL